MSWCICSTTSKGWSRSFADDGAGPIQKQCGENYVLTYQWIITPENHLNSVALSGVSVNLPVLSYQGICVVTTETLTEGYGTRVTNIRTNLDANRQRFIEGLHLYTVSGKELADLRVSNPDAQSSSKTRSLTLWTEKGAARMSKIVDTNQAWDFFEKLEDSYFNLREVYGVMLPNIDDPIQLGRAWTGAIESVWKSS